MKSAFLLSHNPDFDRLVRTHLAARGAHVGADAVQLVDEGPPHRMFHYYGKVKPDLEWEFRDPPWIAADGVPLPDIATVDGYYVECRWEDLFAETMAAIAGASKLPVWVMDSNGVVWDGAAVDPERIHL